MAILVSVSGCSSPSTLFLFSIRRTRTDALEQSHTVVRDRNERLGDCAEALVTRWKCHDSSYGYKGCYWIDDRGSHHRLNTIQRERWASAITSGQATETQPPYTVIKSFLLTGEEGEEVKSKKKSPLEHIRELLTEQMEFDSMRNMKQMVSKGRQQSV